MAKININLKLISMQGAEALDGFNIKDLAAMNRRSGSAESFGIKWQTNHAYVAINRKESRIAKKSWDEQSKD